MAPPIQDLPTRFWDKVSRCIHGLNCTVCCWEWQGALIRRKGKTWHGKFHIGNKMYQANRIAWELTHGPIPEGLWVCHNCPGKDNPVCVNPAHLFLGTPSKNVLDAVAKGTWRPRRGARHYKTALTWEQVCAIRTLQKQGLTHAALGRMFHITPSAVTHIVNYKTWRKPE